MRPIRYGNAVQFLPPLFFAPQIPGFLPSSSKTTTFDTGVFRNIYFIDNEMRSTDFSINSVNINNNNNNSSGSLSGFCLFWKRENGWFWLVGKLTS